MLDRIEAWNVQLLYFDRTASFRILWLHSKQRKKAQKVTISSQLSPVTFMTSYVKMRGCIARVQSCLKRANSFGRLDNGTCRLARRTSQAKFELATYKLIISISKKDILILLTDWVLLNCIHVYITYICIECRLSEDF